MSEGSVENGIEPVEGGLEVKVVPEAVAEDEGVGAGWFGGREKLAEAVQFYFGNRKPDHHLDWAVMSAEGGGWRCNGEEVFY